ncbi:MAG: VCBS repeat-containing protein, partial [Opitutae bacterium]|nr:VCBS repeat-containing protein [Opitutae bacterium]
MAGCKKAEIPIPAPTFKPKKVFENASLFSSTKPCISHVKVVDLDRDGKDDILACDGQQSTVLWLKKHAKGDFIERQLADEMNAPVHAETADLDDDGDLDILVSTMGEIFPNNDRIGSLIVLENDGSQQFKKRVLLENVARVTDARAGDFNGDGKLDIAMAQFGYDQGEIRWLENTGPWQYQSHILLDLSGGINVCLADFDQNGGLDIVALLSQQWEEIYLFRNDGRGNFRST